MGSAGSSLDSRTPISFVRRLATTIATIPASSSSVEHNMRTQVFRDSETIDFVVVGSGAAGGVIARELAQGGFTVVVLEQGPRLSLRDFTRHDELRDWYLGGLTNDVVRNAQTFRDHESKPAELQKFKPALWYGRAVGGASLHYTANYWRLHEIDFIERS